ncbi:MAG: SNF2-related protein [Patulibacter sp.]
MDAAADAPPQPAIDEATRRLFVHGGEAVLAAPYDPSLVEAMRAIPGRAYDPRTKRWHVPLKNARPASLLTLAEQFPQLTLTDEDRAHLTKLSRSGGASFELEVVQPLRDGPHCVSLLACWDDPQLAAFVARFDHYLHPSVGRISVPLTLPCATALAELYDARDDLLWTRALAERVSQLVRRAQQRVPQGTGEPGDGAGHTLPSHTVNIRFTEQRQRLFISTSQPQQLLDALPGAEPDGEQAVLAPASRSVAGVLAVLQRGSLVIRMSPSVRYWLDEHLRWEGQVTALAVDGEPHFAVTGDDEVPPGVLDQPPAKVADPGRWLVPMTAAGAELIEELRASEPMVTLDERARRCLAALAERPQEPVRPALLIAEEIGDGQTEFRLQVLWDAAAGDAFAALPGATTPTARRTTRAGADEDDGATIGDGWNAAELQEFAAHHGIELEPLAEARLSELATDRAETQRLVALSAATTGTMQLRPLPGGEPMPFQVAGVEYALARRRTFIADEQGLGKTLQALLAIEHDGDDGAYPAVILAPASLKLNWKRELARWLPHRSVEVLNGRRTVPAGAEVTVVNYEIVDAQVAALAKLRPGALVLDEAHYCKNPKAKRTKAVVQLASLLPADALRLALTGTPLVNRPKELVPQLRILGRLAEFGSGAGFERRFGAPADRERLHWHLRGSCYVRRVKRDVLPQLPEKQRAVVPMTLSNHGEYAKAERQFVAWLMERFGDSQELAQRLDAASQAEALVKLGVLRRLAGEGKVHTAIHWVRDFLESDEKLVLFAAHREVQRALVDAFPEAVHLLGDDSQVARDAAVQAFQHDPAVRLCICSMKVAAHGFTLTAAANVAFAELGWTPAEHDQAEDRCHRIGQEDSVTAWYLVAPETIDERMLALIEHKRAVVDSVTDGRTAADRSGLDAILAGYLGDPAQAR